MNVLRTYALIALPLFLGGCCAGDRGLYREESNARREMLRDLRDARSQYRNDLRVARDEFRKRANEARMELHSSVHRHHYYYPDSQ
jgi:hypothetical protein